jgi:3-deoxy-7-phosphoheptulonate synthase
VELCHRHRPRRHRRGADGLIIEVHPEPEQAMSDGGQSLKPERFADLVRQVKTIAEAVGRNLAPIPAAASKNGQPAAA